MHTFKSLALFLLLTPLAAQPLIVAHRGASHDAPENTLPAFQLAWKQNADAIEGDFHLTRDGEIICLHDTDTQRTSGTKLIAKDSTLEQLRQLDVGRWKSPQFTNTRIPTFAEVAATVPNGKKFYIEIKCGPEIIPNLLQEIRTARLKPDQVTVISFNADVLRELKRRDRTVRTFWLSSFGKNNPLDPSMDQILKTLRTIHADGFSSKADPRLTAEFLAPLKTHGFEYHCWTVDDPAIARTFLTIGALSITTNRPDFLREALTDD
jgi:glycerophosphoryl diester phosphodiesterase